MRSTDPHTGQVVRWQGGTSDRISEVSYSFFKLSTSPVSSLLYTCLSSLFTSLASDHDCLLLLNNSYQCYHLLSHYCYFYTRNSTHSTLSLLRPLGIVSPLTMFSKRCFQDLPHRSRTHCAIEVNFRFLLKRRFFMDMIFERAPDTRTCSS